MSARSSRRQVDPPDHSRQLDEARDPATPPARLRELAVMPDHQVQRAVAANPSVPRELVLGLLESYPAEVAHNPTLLLWLLERPDFLRQRARVVPALLTVEPPPWLVTALGGLWDRRSLDRADALLGKWLARRPDTPPALLGQLCASGHAGTRAVAARHPEAPDTVLALLRAAGSDAHLRSVVRRRPAATAGQLRSASRLGVWGAQLAAGHPRTPPDLLAELAADGHPLVLEELARRRQLPAGLFAALAERPSEGVRRALLANPDLPRELAARLA